MALKRADNSGSTWLWKYLLFASIFIANTVTHLSQAFLIPPGQTEFVLLGGHEDPTSLSPEDATAFRLIVPNQEERDPSHCEPYEVMIIEDDDCNIYCEVNGVVGHLEIRDPGRRTLRACKTVNNGCNSCMRQIDENHGSTKIFGRCGPGCICQPMGSYTNYLQDKRECEKAMNHSNFEALTRKVFDDKKRIRFQVIIPPIGNRNKKKCEDYESPMTREELLVTGQCRQMCKIEGRFGLVRIEGSHRVIDALPIRFPERCQLPIVQGNSVHLPEFAVASVPGLCDSFGNCVKDDMYQN